MPTEAYPIHLSSITAFPSLREGVPDAAYEPLCQQPPHPMSDNTAPLEHDDFSWFHPGPLLHANGSPAFDRTTLSFHHDNGTLAYSYATGAFHHHNGQPAFDTRTRVLRHSDGSQAFVMPEDHHGSCLCEGRCPDGGTLLYWAKRMRMPLGSGFSLEVGWYDDLCDCITLRFGEIKVADLGNYVRM